MTTTRNAVKAVSVQQVSKGGATNGRDEKKWQVYGIDFVQFDHVGSPRERQEDFWGEVFDDYSACLTACHRLYKQQLPRFLMVYPREYDPNRENMTA